MNAFSLSRNICKKLKRMNIANIHYIRTFSITNKTHNSSYNNLSVAFFGSDEFSVASLEKILQYKKSHPGKIASIDVITRHSKPVGRGLVHTSELPIASYASGLANIVRAESKQEINSLAAKQYDIAIAVSYGKLIPKRFVESLKICGLNVHPSLLPRYSGASPLQYALLNEDKFTGVTVQTLHPSKFDAGRIVLQSEEVPIAKGVSVAELRDILGDKGGDLLVRVINEDLYDTKVEPKYEFSYAAKIGPEMRKVDWNTNTAHQLAVKCHILGNLYCVKQCIKKKKHTTKRVLLYDVEEYEENTHEMEVGQFQLCEKGLVIKTVDGSIVTNRLKFECFSDENAHTFISKLDKRAGKDSLKKFE